MKMRQRKHRFHKITSIKSVYSGLPALHVPQIEPSPAAMQMLREQQIWKVARVKDNVVVLEAHTAEAAQEAIDKAARQKKAKLYLLDSEPFCYEA